MVKESKTIIIFVQKGIETSNILHDSSEYKYYYYKFYGLVYNVCAIFNAKRTKVCKHETWFIHFLNPKCICKSSGVWDTPVNFLVYICGQSQPS